MRIGYPVGMGLERLPVGWKVRGGGNWEKQPRPLITGNPR